MPTDKRKCILLFVKAPVAGTVKTRLADRFEPEAILCLYKGFVADFLAALKTTGYKVCIFYAPPDEKDKIIDWLGNDLLLFSQSDGDLGKRMAAAFLEIFGAGYTDAVLVGSDIPDLPGSIVKEAFDALDRFPAVIGPSTDGGYYLIGFNREGFFKEAFDRIRWSTDRVLDSTIERFDACRRPVYLLPRWQDVDTCEDLVELAGRLRGQPDRLPHTRRALVLLGLL